MLETMYCVFSDMSVKELGLLLNCFKSDSEQVYFIKVLYTNQGQDTNRSLVHCSKSLYERFVKMGFGKRNYQPMTKYYKKPNGFENRYYFHIEPFSIPQDIITTITNQLLIYMVPMDPTIQLPVCMFYYELQNILHECVKSGLLKMDTWWIIPNTQTTLIDMGKVAWRQEDQMIIYFYQSVDKSVIYLLRLLLEKRFVHSHCMRCFLKPILPSAMRPLDSSKSESPMMHHRDDTSRSVH